MKKMTFLACAAMLASTVAFTGCKGDKNEPKANAPQIQTDIAISLPGQVGAPTHHMPGATPQLNGHTDFGTNGMNGITLDTSLPKLRSRTGLTLAVSPKPIANSQSKEKRAILIARFLYPLLRPGWDDIDIAVGIRNILFNYFIITFSVRTHMFN